MRPRLAVRCCSTKHQTHLVDGYFDTERMLNMLNGAVEDALNAGFAGLRTCGDMTWLLDDVLGSEHVVEYEALLNQFFRQTRASGKCQSDESRLPTGLLDHAGICAHSTVVVENTHKRNPFCISDSRGHQSHPATFREKFARLRAE